MNVNLLMRTHLPLMFRVIVMSITSIRVIIVLLLDRSIALTRDMFLHIRCMISIPLHIPLHLSLLRLLLSFLLLIRLLLLLLLLLISFLLLIIILLVLLLMFGRGVLQPKQALPEGFERCITTQLESD
jgi:hypothetical protein